MNDQAGGRGRRPGVSGHGALHGEWPTDVEMPKPVAGNDDRSSVLEITSQRLSAQPTTASMEKRSKLWKRAVQ